MASQMEEIIGVYVSERMRWDETAISTIKEVKEGNLLTIKGVSEPGDLLPQTTYRLYGRWAEYKNKRTQAVEKQFHFATFVKSTPHGRAGTINYLKDVPGIGQKIAEKLWDAFQAEAVRILRESPEVAAAAIGAAYFSAEKAARAGEYLTSEQAMEGCTIDLIDALAGRGFPKTTARAAVRKWGNVAAPIIKRCPYYLMVFRGCGFLKTDAMYMDLGLDPGKLRRQSLCAWHAMASDSSGDTWQPVAFVEKALHQKIGGARIDCFNALRLAKRAKMIATRRDENGRLWVAEFKDANAERRIAEFVGAARLEQNKWPDLSQEITGISEHQGLELEVATMEPIAILGGAPGTGKTFTAAALIQVLVKAFGESHIGVAAPTGKAAVRVTENLQKYNLPLIARTIHSLLGVQKNDATDGWSFMHNESNPLPFLFIVIDESSMIDNSLMASLLAARAPGTCVLFVGDINQLPPVGRGAPLRDMIVTGIPTGTLTEIRRNSGAIVRACHAIKNDQPFETSTTINLASEDPMNLYLIQAGYPDHQIQRMFAGIAAGQDDGLDPVWGCQVLVGVNARSELSRKALNTVLQERLNAGGAQATGNPFRVGDKIVCLKNGFVEIDGEGQVNTIEDIDGAPETDEDGKVYVANGELAEVLRVEEKLTVARLSNPHRIVKIPRGVAKSDSDDSAKDSDDSSAGCTWDLGYALSVHKSQGSEWPLVLVMLDEYPGARMVCSREWLYTAISRAKRLCLLVGKIGTANGMCRRQALGLRKTFLVEEIKAIATAASAASVDSVSEAVA